MANNFQTYTETNFPAQPLTSDFHSGRLTELQFEELCRNNRDLKFEMPRKVHVYRQKGAIEILDNPKKISGEDVLRGFESNVREIR